MSDCILLDKEQVTKVYKEYMIHDFPSNELRPLAMTLDMMDKGVYESYGYIEDEEIVSYAMFVRLGNNYLFDYYAVRSDKRNDGIGSKFLGLLRDKFVTADSVIGEVEDPDCAKTEEERVLQNRRLGFYLRNGFINTGVKCSIFGVDFLILEMSVNEYPLKEDMVQKIYQDLYRSFLPPEMYEKNVIMK